MRSWSALALAVSISLTACARHSQPAESKPGIVSRSLQTLNPLRYWPKKGGKPAQSKSKGVVLKVTTEPGEVSLSETRQIRVTTAVTNASRSRLVALHFPTSQRLEIVLINDSGKVITRWSDDRAFENTPGSVVINPRERVEYVESISVRDMKAGRPYTLEVSVPGHDELKAQIPITPRP